MNVERINLLKQFLAEEPANPFNLYALAIEYLAHAPQQAQFYFDRLLAEHPDYLPTYYHAAALYASVDNRDKAKKVYQSGITLAQLQHNQKTLQELQRAKQMFEEDDEEW